MPKTQQQILGDRGEQVAADFLKASGYEVLDRNWRCKAGELDLVAKDSTGRVIGVEVKTRSSQRFGTGFDAINAAKYRRLQKLLLLWAQSHRTYVPSLRIDVVEVYLLPGDGKVIEHRQDVQS